MVPKKENNIEQISPYPLSSGFQHYPTGRDDVIKNPFLWLDGKRKDDGLGPLWRVKDKLYDLTRFVKEHPGGSFWLEATQGTDITELFESHHVVSDIPAAILEKYFVRDAKTIRNSPFTFEEDGFYKTLKRRVKPILQHVGTNATNQMLFILDSFFAFFLLLLYLSCVKDSMIYAAAAGTVLVFITNISHNFFHQKNNFRMYYFDLSLLSSEEWRISHAISHHMFPNTIYDYEISGFEPLLKFLPDITKDRKLSLKFFIVWLITFCISFWISFLFKFGLVFKGKNVKLQRENVIIFVQLFFIVLLNGSILGGLKLWFFLHTVHQLIFLIIGLTAGHHHPNVYHEGDKAHQNKDWGVNQINATRERGELLSSSLLLSTMSFGNHTLHHLFPTVDASKLVYLNQVFLQTCTEFGIKFKPYTVLEAFKGFFLQLIKFKVNEKPSEILS